MSWSFFNKKKLAPKSSGDREFEREIAKCSELETNTKKLYKGMKRCNEAFEELSKMESKLAQDISTMPYNDEINGLNHAEELVKTLKSLESHRVELAANVVKTTIEPMKKFYGILPSVNSGVKKREQCLQEYTRLRGKVEKYKDKEKTPQNLNKLEQYEKELETARNDYEAQNALMLEGLPQLWEGRVTYFEPCFEALQRSQVDYYSKCCQAYGDLVEKLDSDNVGDEEGAHLDVQDMLTDIRSLSIIENA
ncbi:bridging integrator 3 [Paramuricea clavata]|uniref:Bridging integrator 3 n=1 Tax=Paramuricea clavata TaxID=317549 RepID=A0A7D9IFS0_PARCT|nr:bridging integrator 3 [Paramuricea clavata]